MSSTDCVTHQLWAPSRYSDWCSTILQAGNIGPGSATRNLLHPALTPPASTVQQEAMPGRSLQFREAEVASLKTSHHLPSLLCRSPHWPGREVTHSTHLRLRNSSAVLMHIFKTLSHKTHYSAGWRHVLCGVCALSLYLHLNLHKAILN